MTSFDAFRYDGKRAVVVGGATGMGAAAAELLQSAGADVVVMDFAEVTLPGAKAIHVNLADKASIDAAIDECGGPVARAALVRRRGRRHARHREDQLHRAPPPDRSHARRAACSRRGSAIGFISSAAGLGWEANLDRAEGVPGHARLRRGRRAGSSRTAAPTTCRPSRRSAPTSPRRPSRCSSGASASTPSAPGRPTPRWPRPTRRCGSASAPTTAPRSASRRRRPLEQAYPLVFLCSDAAAAISGITLVTDVGYFASGSTETFPAATPAVNFLLGRM